MAQTTKIGNVTLNFDRYKGMDLYCDGQIEDELLDIVMNNDPSKFPEIIEKKGSWPVLYHLSEQRSNIIEWIPMSGSEKVLEVGSGCGAITGKLSQKSGSVTCVDLSKKRSEINAYRNKNCDNVTIHVGNFKDIEPDLPNDFDYIFLIGVFEYGQGYIGGEYPYDNFLKMLKKHLHAGGRIVIAIENRMGLKYLAGCREDHLGTYFSGIEGYNSESVARTFTRNGLIQIFKRCGINNYHFYYPYPDYKFMTMMHSDYYLPGLGELNDNVRNFDNSRMILFNEKYAFDGLVKDGMYQDFANSFEVIIGNEFPTVFSKYSNDRAAEFKIRTDICVDRAGRRIITKTPLCAEAVDHINSIRDAYEALKERYRGGDLEINDCQIDEKTGVASFSFVNGEPLSSLMDKCLAGDDIEGFEKLFREYLRRISYNEEMAVADYDLIFNNILVNGPIWTVIDYEWTYGKQIPTKEIAFRALYCYLEEDEKRRKIGIDRFYKELGLSEEEAKDLLEEEAGFQKYVTGNRMSMVEIWKKIGKKATVPAELLPPPEVPVFNPEAIKLYYDYGEGFSEENSKELDTEYDKNGKAMIELELDDNVMKLRLDPVSHPCIVSLTSVKWNDERISDDNSALGIHPNGAWLSDESIVFDSDDPWIEFDFTSDELKKRAVNRINIRLTVSSIQKKQAQDLVSYQYAGSDESDDEGLRFSKLKGLFKNGLKKGSTGVSDRKRKA
ncbi:class I SAM-dependent methyltransferase [Butyrivibrio sp. TB]|uniref:class I SAM-dependent methyltransferase n=1 Tax=Butyrivibrio sp. TB TaxID=1520809 RepID=UPI0008BB2BE5|nr:class I SAM-dependent methyltransferase [Butyrivibrio sp. TB]SEQ20745.1 Methyltransferase domain-containing protein [Butyrivibrio sp. TB]